MNWIKDDTKRFRERPYFLDSEIDRECETMITECLKSRNKTVFSPPLDTDTLNVLLEMHSADVNLYADLEATEGIGVEGVTEFQKGKKPKISIDKRLSENEAFINRLRSTMAHELFHARFHLILWELYWLGKTKRVNCHKSHIIMAGKTDWYEWQAAYGSGAILMPRSALIGLVGAGSLVPEVSSEGQALITLVSSNFQVSRDAARVRLTQLKTLKGSPRPLVSTPGA